MTGLTLFAALPLNAFGLALIFEFEQGVYGVMIGPVILGVRVLR